MHDTMSSSTAKWRRSSISLFLLLIVVSLFSNSEFGVHAAPSSSLTKRSSLTFSFKHHHVPSMKRQLAIFSSRHQITVPPPALMITWINLPETSSHGTSIIAYRLSVSNGSSAGPVAAGNTILLSNVIPAGLTGILVKASKSDWTLQLAAKTSPTILTATYIGTYPVLAGTTLSPILIRGILKQTTPSYTFLPIGVRIVHSKPLVIR